MQQLTRLQILCFLRFSMPNLLIGLVLVVAGVYGLVTAMPPVESLPFVSFADYRLVYGLGTALGGAFAGFGIRSGLESIRYDGED